MSDSAKAIRRLQHGALFAPVSFKQSVVPQGVAGAFDHIKTAPPNAIFLTGTQFKKSTNPNKINLGVGAYRDENGKPFPLPCVLKAEEELAQDMTRNKEYLPIGGSDDFCKAARELLFGENSAHVTSGRVGSCQSISGTGALRIGMEFIAKYLPGRMILVSDPTWGNHGTIAKAAGCNFKKYSYWDAKNRCLNIDGMLADLRAAPQGSVVLLHACAHNPTGVDPTHAQWKQISDVVKQNKLFPFMDSAYQGFASGDPDYDAFAVRLFADEGHDMIIAQSFAKNFGLYCERAGALHICGDAAGVKSAISNLKLIIRHMYSNPPAHGARIVNHILTNPALKAQWRREMKVMSDRIREMRSALKAELIRLGTPGNWDHVTSQIGMFTFTGLSVKQCQVLKTKHDCYLLDNGRISMAGLNGKNVAYFARSVDDVVRNY